MTANHCKDAHPGLDTFRITSSRVESVCSVKNSVEEEQLLGHRGSMNSPQRVEIWSSVQQKSQVYHFSIVDDWL
jgi:hypothetical protein